MDLQGKNLRIILRRNNYRFTGRCTSEDDQFIIIDDRTGTKAFAKADIAGYEVLD